MTTGGVKHLASVLDRVRDTSVEITARAADVTEPEALLMLRDDLDADVSIVIGQHSRSFHPKLWIIERPDKTVVLSGSGNLTGGGLVINDEQFEVIEYAPGADVVAQHERFDHLTRYSQPLDSIEHTAIWHEWLAVRKQQAHARRELARIEQVFITRAPMPDRASDKAKLIEALQQIYDDTVAADLPRADGEQYRPTRLLVAINEARAGERDPVNVVSNTIRKHTDGLDILLQAGRVDLTLEWLVLDGSQPFHDLFSARSIDIARARIEQYREAGYQVPEPGTPRRPVVSQVMSNEDVRAALDRLLKNQPCGHDLPVLHKARATLLHVDGRHADVRRDSGSTAHIPVRLIRMRLNELAAGERFRVSELGERGSDRFNSAFGALLAALPGVQFESKEQRLYYSED